MLVFFLFFLRSSVLELKIEHLNRHQVNHHGKTITVGGEKDSDKDPLVERVAVHNHFQNIQNFQNVSNIQKIQNSDKDPLVERVAVHIYSKYLKYSKYSKC